MTETKINETEQEMAILWAIACGVILLALISIITVSLVLLSRWAIETAKTAKEQSGKNGKT